MRPLCALLGIYLSSAQSLPTQSFQVAASVVAGCVISGSNTGVFGALDFGTRSGVDNGSVSASYVQSSTINLACTPGTTLNMSINGGNNYATTRNLKLANYSNVVGYQIFTSASHSAASEIPVSQNVALSYGNANNITLPIYGLLQLNGVARAGNYTDTLTVTLSW
ncbi:spore coat U domain-containing protein [Pantoea sp. B65]|uniref:Csu type fimbrial protein n=1 Tax=Pantoea sp. B65 TaxID=2813359 RepID=UPI0039B65EBF